jgi:hypothetical protein
MYKLFLDDERDPYKVTWVEMPLGPWEIVRSYAEFVKTITEKGLPSFVAFDHDLADEHYRRSMYNPDRHYSNYYTDGTFKEKTGYECAVWLVNYCIDNNTDFPQYVVHSMNPIGKENIVSYIESYKRSKL